MAENIDLGGYVFHFDKIEKQNGPNYAAHTAFIRVMNGDSMVDVLKPEKRIYMVQGMPMTEAGIDPGLFRDIYVALGEPLEGGAWAVRLYVKPFIRWIWFGGVFMAIGGFLAASDRRYRVAKRVMKNVQASTDNDAAENAA